MVQKLLRVKKDVLLQLISVVVFFHGLLITLTSLESHIVIRRYVWDSRVQISIGIIAGVTLIYLSLLIRRRKYTAWLVSVCVYAFILGANMITLAFSYQSASIFLDVTRVLVLPLFVLGLLLYYRREFTVRSDVRSFRITARYVFILLCVAFFYGVIGFELLEKQDFRAELTLWQSALYTIDQFGVVSGQALQAYTERGRLFLDSLSLISGLSIGYAFIALFQPVRARLEHQDKGRAETKHILDTYGGSSEDFFKLWPKDKAYMFSDDQDAAVAFHVTRGVALAVGDPVGSTTGILGCMKNFLEVCKTNDWLPAFIHAENTHNAMYRSMGFSVQKIGEEAVVDISAFLEHYKDNKYFRQIENRFSKQHYSVEKLMPPHNSALLQRLKHVSDEWLNRPGRSERGFMMGYFSEEYMQMCTIVVLRDAAGTIQAFINQVPSYDSHEANYDLLRYSKTALGNTNDYLLLSFIKLLHDDGPKRLNMGLCPLAGIGDDTVEESRLLDTLLSFVYANGNRVYSFTGVHKFKSKYDPIWRDRYIVYRGGLAGLSRTLRALARAMKR